MRSLLGAMYASAGTSSEYESSIVPSDLVNHEACLLSRSGGRYGAGTLFPPLRGRLPKRSGPPDELSDRSLTSPLEATGIENCMSSRDAPRDRYLLFGDLLRLKRQ
jgi:hypothetical protein